MLWLEVSLSTFEKTVNLDIQPNKEGTGENTCQVKHVETRTKYHFLITIFQNRVDCQAVRNKTGVGKMRWISNYLNERVTG